MVLGETDVFPENKASVFGLLVRAWHSIWHFD